MKTVEFLLLTPRNEQARARKLLGQLRQVSEGIKIRIVGCLPARREKFLTTRQTEVLRGIAQGASVKEIATRLRISGKTVETHRAALAERLGIRRVPELVRYAIQTGVIPFSWIAQRSHARIDPVPGNVS